MLFTFTIMAFALLLCGCAVTFFISLAGLSNRYAGWVALMFVVLSSVIILGVCGNVFISGSPVSGEIKTFSIAALNASLHFEIDRLSAFFMGLIVVLSIPVTMYSISYMEHEKDIIGYYPPLLLFIMGMLGVICIDDFFFFFVPWEFMSLSAYALILFEKKDPNVLRAALKYFIVTHFGNICMFVGAVILYFYLPGREASFSFAAISQSMSMMNMTNPVLLNLALALLFLGFATKAGIFPFGFLWLPDAHPAAPSPVSSLLSGLMVKIGIYGIIRTFLFILPIGNITSGWGWIIAFFGTLSLFFGTLRALMQRDSKVLLAYSTIGQMGYVMLSLGIGMIFIRTVPLIAIIGLIACIYHLINHMFFKGLLFLVAGSVIHQTGTRDMDKLGGLTKLLPVTSFAALAGILSLGGLPGFSGFVSKWMIYQASIFGGIKYPLILLMGIMAIFISVATIVYALKFYGAQFLGHMPKKHQSLQTNEKLTMRIPLIALSLASIIMGIVPVLGIFPGYTVFSDLPFFSDSGYNIAFGSMNPFRIVLHAVTPSGIVKTIGVWNPVLVVIVLGVLGFISYGFIRSFGASRRTVENWYCGTVADTDETIYRSSSYYVYLKDFFKLVNTQILPRKLEFKTDFSRILNIDNWFYYPLSRRLLSLSRWIARTHVGIPQIYVLWTVVGAIVTIVVLFWVSGGK